MLPRCRPNVVRRSSVRDVLNMVWGALRQQA